DEAARDGQRRGQDVGAIAPREQHPAGDDDGSDAERGEVQLLLPVTQRSGHQVEHVEDGPPREPDAPRLRFFDQRRRGFGAKPLPAQASGARSKAANSALTFMLFRRTFRDTSASLRARIEARVSRFMRSTARRMYADRESFMHRPWRDGRHARWKNSLRTRSGCSQMSDLRKPNSLLMRSWAISVSTCSS